MSRTIVADQKRPLRSTAPVVEAHAVLRMATRASRSATSRPPAAVEPEDAGLERRDEAAVACRPMQPMRSSTGQVVVSAARRIEPVQQAPFDVDPPERALGDRPERAFADARARRDTAPLRRPNGTFERPAGLAPSPAAGPPSGRAPRGRGAHPYGPWSRSRRPGRRPPDRCGRARLARLGRGPVRLELSFGR
jgi:hypothetical protein